MSAKTWLKLLSVGLAAGCLAGCEFVDALRDMESAEFAEWVSEELPSATAVAVRDGVVELTKPDGSVSSRPLPGGDADGPGAVFGERALEAIERAVETGSPWPAVAGVLEAAGLAGLAYLLRRKQRSLASAREHGEAREKQLQAAVRGLASAPVDAGSKRAVAAQVKRLAKRLNVEDGELGLNRFVTAECSNVYEQDTEEKK